MKGEGQVDRGEGGGGGDGKKEKVCQEVSGGDLSLFLTVLRSEDLGRGVSLYLTHSCTSIPLVPSHSPSPLSLTISPPTHYLPSHSPSPLPLTISPPTHHLPSNSPSPLSILPTPPFLTCSFTLSMVPRKNSFLEQMLTALRSPPWGLTPTWNCTCEEQ